jgi:hypothetical protein
MQRTRLLNGESSERGKATTTSDIHLIGITQTGGYFGKTVAFLDRIYLKPRKLSPGHYQPEPWRRSAASC